MTSQLVGHQKGHELKTSKTSMTGWNAKCPIFLGNFTPKTSNSCLKNGALGFPGGWKMFKTMNEYMYLLLKMMGDFPAIVMLVFVGVQVVVSKKNVHPSLPGGNDPI